ncbi:TPA: glycosyl transferase family 2, partial [Patescibacteria group bacterium]|nr:glycosyl transferase family 2 [Patescibacteria group bacterium]
AYARGFKISQIDIPVRYFSEASSIQFVKGSKFLLQTLFLLLRFLLHKTGLTVDPLFTSRYAHAK